jgi:hypothetical protein
MKPAYPRPIRRSSRLKPETFDHNGPRVCCVDGEYELQLNLAQHAIGQHR